MSIRKLPSVDLLPKKPNPKVLAIQGSTVAEIQIEVIPKNGKDVPSTLMDRCADAAKSEIVRYQKVIIEEVAKLEGKVTALQAQNKSEDADKMVADTNTAIAGAVRGLQNAVNVAVKARLTREARDDRNLLESRVIAGVKIAFKVVSVAKNAATVAASGGVDVTAWISLAKDIVGLASLIYDQTKGVVKLRDDLDKTIADMNRDKLMQVNEQIKAAASRKAKFVFVAKEIYRKLKPKAALAETARKKFRDGVTAARQNVDKLAVKIDAIFQKVKAAKSLKEGVALGSTMMDMKGKLKIMDGEYRKAEGYLDDITKLLSEAGLAVDDTPYTQRLTSLSSVKDLLSGAAGILSCANDLRSTIESISAI